MESLSLENKVAVVTGANSGLGFAIASLFARRGASVVLCDKDEMDRALNQCMQASAGQADRFLSVRGDLNEAGVRKNILDRTVDKFGRLDILVCNAGIIVSNMSIRNTTEESYNAVMDTNLKSVFFLIQEALPHLEKSKGNIVSTSSIASTAVVKDLSLYMMSKAALDHMTSSLALDLAPSGIRVNAVNPSFFQSNILHTMSDDKEYLDKVHLHENSLCPLHGKIVTKEKIAEVVAFLASDSAMCVTGQTHVIDNGRHFMSFSGIPEVATISANGSK